MDEGYIHIYTGNGKGKTTAALGLALRAACAGYKTFVAQFMKGFPYNELKATEKIPSIVFEQFGDVCFVGSVPSPKDYELSEKALKRISDVLNSNEYDVVIMDEINMALYFKLVDLEDVIELLNNKPPHVELVLTGRYAPEKLIEMADLVTEMEEVKHYYNDGVESRTGIDK